jgi:hypothetical protein
VDEAAEPLAAVDARGWRFQDGGSCSGTNWRREVERAVWPMRVVVVDVDEEYALEVAAVED